MNYKFISSLLFIYFSNLFSSQAPAMQWQKNYGGSQPEMFPDIALTSDGGYILAGSSASTNGNVTGNHGLNDFWVVRTNSTGDILWQKSLGGSAGDAASSVRQTSDGGYIVAGSSSSNNGDVTGNHGSSDFWIVKLDTSGNLQWQKSFGGSNEEIAQSIRQTTDGGYIVAGYTASSDGDVASGNGGYRDYWVIKLNATGNLQWEKTYGGGSGDQAYSIEQTTDGGYIIGGYSNSIDNIVTGNHGSDDYWIVKINAAGVLQWQKSLGGSGTDRAFSVKQTSDGGYIAFGQSISTNGDITGSHGNDDYWLAKLSSTGILQWQKSYGGSLYDRGRDVSQTADGGYIMTGVSFPLNVEGTTSNGANDYLIVKTDASGNMEWQQTYGGLQDDYGTFVKQTLDGGYILCGYSDAITNSSSNYDYWIIKLAGNQLSTDENILKNNISMYPNPAKDFVTIDHLPNETTISILDLSGRKIFSKKYTEPKVSIHTSQLTNGTYIIQVDDQEKTILSEKLMIKK
ncbi:T9SS type A sorting domain-containing protein [Chryseobacterium gwangjuense]|uniref:T9SS type A sorting domain-containing protein n=1 Tax=Chryseobacterium gwangjuense TaxID=1069980 RepID=UPI001E43AC38|nr:T9SS type A sorting domain-containing protein [Chryseobacterium gwangjuense]MCE3077210.1 T9SS type A sorting domain-containing protein [Chryseobacterium gwangjuense]